MTIYESCAAKVLVLLKVYVVLFNSTSRPTVSDYVCSFFVEPPFLILLPDT